jgi:hypothetical protein
MGLKVKIRWTKLLTVFDYIFGLSNSIVIFITFMKAYYSPTKAVKVTINTFNEANTEIAFITIIMGIVIL